MDDWEILQCSDTESTDSITSVKKLECVSLIDDGMILSDHFSATDLSHYGVIESGEVGVDLGFDQFNVNQSGVDCVRNELGVYDSETRILSDFEVANVESKDVAELTDAIKRFSEADGLEVVADGRQSGVEEPIEDSSKSCSDLGGCELVSGDSGVVNGEDEIVSDGGVASSEAFEGNEGNIREVVAANSDDEGKSRETVWWKMPFVLLKYSVFKIGPVWSVSMAAAVMGLVLLGRRLYNMKKKAQRFHLKVTIDEKKASQVMSQAARLNEVFTEVRRVPVIRPALPSPGAWPVLSLR